jgi:hypothetical protein
MIRFSPRPNTRGRPERRAVCRIRSQYSSMNAPARTIVQGVPGSRSRSSATAFIRNSSIGSVGDAPSTDMRTTCAFRAAAASIRQALPSRSTDAGVTPPWHWCARTSVWCLCRWWPRLRAASRSADGPPPLRVRRSSRPDQ